ncbi:methionyl-tRNA formyltransferase [Pacificimonas sp. WHA3]|uniref:Methionyl-tRNA formyltransferase n=1 Tax=Pacificimonas pallii TaxID=2827236 RepID=A0ABS6SDL9_9SPHN|nr:methionyl-tRNA formyltransferase [Pacificimonas pallii]MBV7256350.1 methionyl-tRNA formyltransferase [Pacificimonas pallii]
MRIIFMGTPPFAATALREIHAAGHQIAAVYTQPPRAARRGKKPQQTAVHALAETRGLDVRHPASLRPAAAQAEFAALDADIAIVAAYGLILPQAVLDAPQHGCINIHASLLPRWRGAAPVQRAIMAGDRVTGVTIMQMEAGLDTGPMLLTRQVEIAGKTAGMLTDELAIVGAAAALEALENLDALTPEPQPDEGASYAAKIDKAEAALDFTASAIDIERTVRALNPAPGAWFWANGERIKLLETAVLAGEKASPGTLLHDGRAIACAEGAVRLRLVQRPGKRPMGIDDLLNGFDMPESVPPCSASA